MTAGDQVTIDIARRGTYHSAVRTLLLDVVHPGRAPHWVALDGDRIPQLLYREHFDAVDVGWHYQPTLGSVLIKTPNPDGDLVVAISFEPIDMLGM